MPFPTEVLENFNDLSAWLIYGSGGVVSGNKVAGGGSGNQINWRGIQSGNKFRIRFVITPSTNAGDHGIFGGFTITDAPGASTLGSGGNYLANAKCIAYRNSNYGGFVMYDGITNTTHLIKPNAEIDNTGATSYLCQITSDGTYVTYSVSKLDGSADKQYTEVANYTPTNLLLQVYDTDRYMFKFGFRNDFQQYSDSSFNHVLVICPQIGGTSPNTYIRVPANFTTAMNPFGVLCFHGYGSTAISQWRDTTNIRGVVDNLVSNGYICAASDGDSTANWGNPAGVTAYYNLYQYLITNFGIKTKMNILANSMGSLCALILAYTYKSLINAIVITSGASDLVNDYFNPSFTASVNAAYGIAGSTPSSTFDSTGRNPHLRLRELAQFPIKEWHSTDDTVIPYAVAQNLYNTINNYGGNATLITTTGGHSSAAIWDATNTSNFFNSPPVVGTLKSKYKF